VTYLTTNEETIKSRSDSANNTCRQIFKDKVKIPENKITSMAIQVVTSTTKHWFLQEG
jgi:hypothetical protein